MNEGQTEEPGVETPFGIVPKSIVDLATDKKTGFVDADVLRDFSHGQARVEGHDPNTVPVKDNTKKIGSQKARKIA